MSTPEPRSVRAVLFDLDGTLLDTLEDLAASMNHVLDARGWPQHEAAAYRHFVGEGVDELARRAAPPDCDEATLGALVKDMRAHYKDHWAVRSRPYPGVPELLEELGRRGLKLAVLSNKMEEFTRGMVSRFLNLWRFAAVIGASPRFPLKPDPRSALAIATALRVSPGEFLYLGDTSIDMRTAVAAGMEPIGALWGFRDADELRASGARHLLSAPLELLPLLGPEPGEEPPAAPESTTGGRLN